jgi:hypothetical protein
MQIFALSWPAQPVTADAQRLRWAKRPDRPRAMTEPNENEEARPLGSSAAC